MRTTVTFNYGAMNSGKSLELLKVAYNYEEQGHNTLILKPKLDTRMPGYVFSRTGLKRKATEITSDKRELVNILEETYQDIIAILVEEANFLEPEIIDTLIDFCYEKNVSTIMFFGLKVDFRGQLFPGTLRLLERADKIEEATSICWCGRKARQNARVINGEIIKEGPQLLIDDGSSKIEYITLCNYHYYKNMLEETDNN